MRHRTTLTVSLGVIFAVLTCVQNVADEPTTSSQVPPQIQKWLRPQQWNRDTEGPVVRLGTAGEFDDTHLFAPCVVKLDDVYHLWYSGSTGTVADRVFNLGLATSFDGRLFTKHSSNPVLEFGDNKHSVLTTTLLRSSDGFPQRENGKLRMWFSSTHFSGGTGQHALHETQSIDGVHWEQPSKPLLEHVYSPTILKDGDKYRMWYTDVSGKTWVFRHAISNDGRLWRVHPDPVLKPEATWEQSRIFYPTVLRVDGVFVMWYGSYWSQRRNTTAIGVAASVDGLRWYRNPHSPVLTPDPDRSWESHYTTSQSVIRNGDGSFRIWYASRKKPPFVNKYFAINTALWAGPDAVAETASNELSVAPVTSLANGTMTVLRRKDSQPQDLLIHFHGAASTVNAAFRKSELDVVLAIVNFPGLTSAYSKPFATDPALFEQILTLAGRPAAVASAKSAMPWRRIYVSSFSAGYGAVRQILKTPKYFHQIDGIAAADSIYAGLQQEVPLRQVSESNMRDFLRFASLAVDRKKVFVVSHSAQPTPYASTTETADLLLRSLNIPRLPDKKIQTEHLTQTSDACRGQLHVQGFAGTSGQDHMQHLHNIDLFWKQLRPAE
ncbi:MAG: hypothetical protein ABGZ53_36225 [Fuerstiella sp.]